MDWGALLHALSKLYSLLILPPDKFSLPCLVKWESDLNRTFTMEQKPNIIWFALKSSIYTRVQEDNFKFLTRWYGTPSILHKYLLATTDRCWRCPEERGTLLYIFWSCSTWMTRLFSFSMFQTCLQKFTRNLFYAIFLTPPNVFLLDQRAHSLRPLAPQS